MVLVTGASGHIGGNLVRALLGEGRKVRALVRSDRRALEGLPLETAAGNVLDYASLEKALRGCDTVFHLGAVISVGDDKREWGGLLQVNIEGTRNVLRACRETGVKRLVHFSSIHAISGVNDEGLMTEACGYYEDENCLPYNRSKAAAEKEILKAVDQGLDAVIVNPTSVIGVNDFKPSHMGQLFLDLYRGKFPVLIDAGFDWVDVRDVVNGALAAEKKGKTGERYILAGHYAKLKDLALLIEKCTGRRMPRLVAPIWVAHVGVPFLAIYSKIIGKRPLLTSGSLEALAGYRPIDNTKARKDLGYEPRSLEATIKDTFEWFKKAGML